MLHACFQVHSPCLCAAALRPSCDALCPVLWCPGMWSGPGRVPPGTRQPQTQAAAWAHHPSRSRHHRLAADSRMHSQDVSSRCCYRSSRTTGILGNEVRNLLLVLPAQVQHQAGTSGASTRTVVATCCVCAHDGACMPATDCCSASACISNCCASACIQGCCASTYTRVCTLLMPMRPGHCPA